jgi:3-deoxy-D-manno-octulosonate 8-phosphate phosphatase (KDO 8-P phosphatase)
VTARSRTVRAREIRLLLLDVDGVLTDGRLVYGPRGEEQKVFHVRDGFAIVAAQAAGLIVGVISGRESPAVATRLAELGVQEIHQRVPDKAALLPELCRRHAVGPDRVAFMGDDVPDLPLLKAVGLALAPGDAAVEVRRAAAWTSLRPGGAGAVRDAVEWLLRARGAWPPG